MGRTDFFHDPRAPRANSLVPAAGILAVDDDGRLLLQRRRDTGQWAIHSRTSPLHNARSRAQAEQRAPTGRDGHRVSDARRVRSPVGSPRTPVSSRVSRTAHSVGVSPSSILPTRPRWRRCSLWWRRFSARTRRRWRSPRISIRSVSSAHRVRIQRSAYAFARGHCGGVFTTSMPAPARTWSKASVNCPPRSPSRTVSVSALLPRSIRKLRAACAVHAPDPLESDRAVDGCEIAGERGRGMGFQEPAPGDAVAYGCGRDPAATQQALDRGAGDLDPEPPQLASDALIASSGILAGQPLNQGPGFGIEPGTSARFGYVRFRAVSRLCQRSSVSGVTSRRRRKPVGSRCMSAASSARSVRSSRGLGFARRSIATSCRRIKISAFSGARDRVSTASHPGTRVKVGQGSRGDTAPDRPRSETAHHPSSQGCWKE